VPQDARSPAFQVYTKDFLSDPNVMAMDNRQVGVYWKLILICWQQDGLPRDDRQLAAMVGENLAWWKRNSAPILKCFKKVRGSKFNHPRLQSERAKQTKTRIARQEAAKKGNEKRWKNQEDTSQGDPPAITKDRLSSPTPTPTPVIPSSDVVDTTEHYEDRNSYDDPRRRHKLSDPDWQPPDGVIQRLRMNGIPEEFAREPTRLFDFKTHYAQAGADIPNFDLKYVQWVTKDWRNLQDGNTDESGRELSIAEQNTRDILAGR
jgi:uncharacterized protein YdaU (DUF1376 family)